MIKFTIFLLKYGMFCTDKDVRIGDVGEFVCFFLNIRRACIAVKLNVQSWD